MRTTLDIEESILLYLKEVAKKQRKSIGEVASELIGKFVKNEISKKTKYSKNKYNLPLLPQSGTNRVVTTEFIKKMKEEINY